jgi:hypothetical protein
MAGLTSDPVRQRSLTEILRRRRNERQPCVTQGLILVLVRLFRDGKLHHLHVRRTMEEFVNLVEAESARLPPVPQGYLPGCLERELLWRFFEHRSLDTFLGRRVRALQTAVYDVLQSGDER